MEFSKDIKELFRKAGWFYGRNVKGEYRLPLNNYPTFATLFLDEYANLTTKCVTLDYTPVINELEIIPELAEPEYLEDGLYPYYASLVKKPLFSIGYESSSSLICCDNEERVYMIHDGIYFRGRNLYEGITNIMRSDWEFSLTLDEDTGKWWNRSGEYVPLP
jgi:hypothetical protein